MGVSTFDPPSSGRNRKNKDTHKQRLPRPPFPSPNLSFVAMEIDRSYAFPQQQPKSCDATQQSLWAAPPSAEAFPAVRKAGGGVGDSGRG